MTNQLSNEEEKELSSLYLQAIIIADKFANVDSNESEAIIGMNNILTSVKPIVEASYQKKNLKGMRMIISDFKEMFSGCSDEDRQATNKIFKQNNLAEW